MVPKQEVDMAFINPVDRKKLEEEFNKLPEPVEIILFTQAINCEYCGDTELLLKELAEISDKVNLTVKNFTIDKEDVERYGIDRVPAIVVRNAEKDYGIRFFGIPAGYEFASLIEAIRLVSYKMTVLDEELRNRVKEVDKPLLIQVFVTPTCPYCPRAVLTAYQIAMENDNVTAHAVEVSEYPELANKYAVTGVPKTVVDDRVEFVGAVPDHVFVENVLKAVNL